MTSFQLVNQKLRYMFGGVQPEVNSSVEFLNSEHKRISNTLQTSSSLYRKIHTACQTLKQCSAQLLEMYKSETKTSHTIEAGSIQAVVNEIGKSWGNMGQEIIEMKKRIDNQLDSFLPSIKKFYIDHKEAAEELEHYKEKVFLLQKRVGDVTISRDDSRYPGDEQIERYHRNQEKLKNSQGKYDDIVQKITEKCQNFNQDGETLLINNYADFITTVTDNQQHLRISINNWLRSKDKKCHCQNGSLLKNRIHDFVKGQFYTKHVQPVCIKQFMKKAEGFKSLDNVFGDPLHAQSKPVSRSPVDLMDSFGVQGQNVDFMKNQAASTPRQKTMRKKSDETFVSLFNKQSVLDPVDEDLSTKVEAAKKVLVQQRNEKPNFGDFLDIMNM